MQPPNNLLTLSTEGTFNAIDLLRIVKRNLPRILGAAIFVSLIVGLVNLFWIDPYFVARGTIVSTSKETQVAIGSVAQALAQARGASNELLQYQKILETRNLASIVSADTKADTPEGILQGVSVRVDGPILELSYKNTSPEIAAKVVQSYFDNFDLFMQKNAAKKAIENAAFIKDRLKETTEALQQLEGKMSQLKFSDANREYQIQTKVVMLLREQYELAQIESKKQQTLFLVIDPPTIPKAKSGPKVFLNTFLALVLTLMITTILTVALTLMRREMHRGPAAKRGFDRPAEG